jgi:hypothetical protein
MTRIIWKLLIQGIYLQSEKDIIPFSVDYVTKTGTAGFRLCR